MKKFINSMLDTYLPKIGLVRHTVYQQTNDSWKVYTAKLGEAAKDKGVKVVFDNESLQNIMIDSDLFILGSRNYIGNCDFTGSTVNVAPQCEMNYLSNNRFFAGNGDFK